MSCKVMRVSKSAYYAWRKRLAIIISAQTLNLHHRAKALFETSPGSLGWHTSEHMTTDLIERAFLKAHSRRQPPKGLVFHSDRARNP